MKHVSFSGDILFLGFGGVARCTLPLILKHLDVPASHVTVMDMVDSGPAADAYRAMGVTFVQERLQRETYKEQLASRLKRGDVLIDLAWNIDCTDLLQWCHDYGVLYVNTSVELWDPYSLNDAQPTERTLYVRHQAIRALVASWNEPGPTAVLEHGANPGLVSHFMKKALLDIAAQVRELPEATAEKGAIDRAVASRDFPALAHALNVQAIHISEIDTQVSSLPHDPKIFRNTWSVEGLFEEGVAPAELGWGSHERALPEDGCTHASGPQNAICLSTPSIDTFVKSRVPSTDIVGMVVRHGEAVTISHYLTHTDDTGTYRPTVHYAYKPSPETRRCLQEVRERGYVMHPSWEILSDDITTGHDELGVLLMGHRLKSWWTGTVLSIDEARALVPHQNATTLQVAASVMAAVVWMIEHPTQGVCFPEALPHERILELATPYLGTVPSAALDWSPTGNNDADAWQFSSFRTQAPATDA